MGQKKRVLRGVVGLILAISFVNEARAEIAPGAWLEIRILLDNSGSMYPGYSPESGLRKTSLGVKWAYEYSSFQSWLDDFVRAQTIVQGGSGQGRVSLAVATSSRKFTDADIRQVHPRVELNDFHAARLEPAINQAGKGTHTFLLSALEAISADFEGLVWLITDNIVEEPGGQPVEGVRDFFAALRDRPRYRAVHLYKHSIVDSPNGQKLDLAVYGILVSSDEVKSPDTFDFKFRDRILRHSRPGHEGRLLFPTQEYLKLKDLRIDPLSPLQGALNVTLEKNAFSIRESRPITLNLDLELTSNLTQHAVSGGQFTLLFPDGLEPATLQELAFAPPRIPSSVFGRPAASGTIDRSIPPGAQRRVHVTVETEPISLTPPLLKPWLRVAWNGVKVDYVGLVEIRFGSLPVQLQMQRMQGIFGVDQASEIFDFQDVPSINPRPVKRQIRITIEDSGRRRWILAMILLLIGAVSAPILWFLLRTLKYEVTVGGRSQVIDLRWRQKAPVADDDRQLAWLARTLGGRPHLQSAAPDIILKPRSNYYEASTRSGKTVKIVVNQPGRDPLPLGSRASSAARDRKFRLLGGGRERNSEVTSGRKEAGSHDDDPKASSPVSGSTRRRARKRRFPRP